jgi:hypothetical protein
MLQLFWKNQLGMFFSVSLCHVISLGQGSLDGLTDCLGQEELICKEHNEHYAEKYKRFCKEIYIDSRFCNEIKENLLESMKMISCNMD